MPASPEDVTKEIELFRRHLSGEFPSLNTAHGFDKVDFRSYWDERRRQGMWQKSGVYLIYDIDGNLLYVGKATATFEKRVLQKFSGMARANSVDVIPFPSGFEFMAPALEEFLIARLRPAINKCGKYRFAHCTSDVPPANMG